MESYLNSILDNVPDDIRLDTEEYISDYISVFEPKEYVTGQKINLDHYHFVIFNSNPPLLQIGNSEYQFHKHSLISLEPEMDLMVLPFDGKGKSDYFAISISKDFFKKIAFEVLGKNKVEFNKIESGYSRKLLDLVSNFKYELVNYGGKYPTMLNSISAQIAFQLLRDMNTDGPVFRKNSYNEQKYINKALVYMENNLDCNITLEEISREVFVSQAHFERIFKYHIGQTPHQYLVAIRIQKAKELLIKEECSVEEIARRCGFVSLSHFSTVFKQYVGVNPTSYKKIS